MGTDQDLNRRTGADSTALKRDIDHTRSRMDETIDALSARLQPRNLVHEALGWAGYTTRRAASPEDAMSSFLKSIASDMLHSFRGAASQAAMTGAKKAGVKAWGVARCHPMPAAMIGAGLAWLAYESSCSPATKASLKGWTLRRSEPEYGGSYVDARTGRPYSEGPAYGSEAAANTGARAPRSSPTPEPTYGGSYVDARSGEPYNPSTYRQEAQSMKPEDTYGESNEPTRQSHTDRITDRARHAASDAAASVRGGLHRVTDTADSGIHYVSDAARAAAHRLTHGVSSTASTAAHTVTHTAHSAAHHVRSGLDYSRHQVRHAVDEYPLAVGAVALGVGVLLGLALPRTRREEQVLGERARQLREQAKQRAQEALERGRRAARETMHVVTEEAERQGLTPAALKDSARNFARTAADDLRSDAQEAGFSTRAVKEKASRIAASARDTATREMAGQGEDSENRAGE